jgi:hypothetical protein
VVNCILARAASASLKPKQFRAQPWIIWNLDAARGEHREHGEICLAAIHFRNLKRDTSIAIDGS